jgi:hypothetical protein
MCLFDLEDAICCSVVAGQDMMQNLRCKADPEDDSRVDCAESNKRATFEC